MGVKSLVKKYKDYEVKELNRRLTKKRKLAAYKSLKSKKKNPIVRATKLKFDKKKYTKAIGNPYKVKV